VEISVPDAATPYPDILDQRQLSGTRFPVWLQFTRRTMRVADDATGGEEEYGAYAVGSHWPTAATPNHALS
jgi:hypothetical protein